MWASNSSTFGLTSSVSVMISVFGTTIRSAIMLVDIASGVTDDVGGGGGGIDGGACINDG